MPDEDADYTRRGARLTPVLFWAGLGLTPLAGLLLLLGNPGLRAGALLGMLALAMIGLSIALRPDPVQVRLQLEETLLQELDQLRAEVRQEIANASRATHQTVGERMGALQHLVESLRAERARFGAPHSAVPTVAGQHPAAPHPAAAPPVGSHPVGSHPVGSRPVGSRPVAPPPMAAPRSAPPQPDPTMRRPDPSAGRHPGPPVSAPAAAGRPGGRGARHQEAAPAHPAAAPPSGRAAAPPPAGGVYRHTETVHVTTRSTYVDEHAPNGDGGRRTDGGYGGVDWSDQAPRGRPAEPYQEPYQEAPYQEAPYQETPYQESWTDQKLRERYGRRPRPYDRADDASGEQPWSRDDAPWHPVSAEPVSGPGPATPPGRRRRRWDGEPASEVRLGERRAAARHSDEHGTELRLEERWASMRRDDPGRPRAGQRGADHPGTDYRGSDFHSSDHRGPDYRASDYPGPANQDTDHRDGAYRDTGYRNGDHGSAGADRGPEPDYTRPALPASSTEPSWNDSWEEPVRESRGHRYRPDFALSDERWR